MGQDKVLKTKPTNTVTPSTNQQVQDAINGQMVPALQQPLPIPRDAAETLRLNQGQALPSPGVMGKAQTGMELIKTGMDVYNSVKQAEANTAVIDIAGELRCLNEKLTQVLFNATAELEFYQNLLRSQAQICAAIKMHAQITNNAFALDPYDVSVQSNPDGQNILTFDENANDVWTSPGGREQLVKCTKENGG